MRWAGHVDRMEESRSAFKMLTGKPTGKRPLGRPRRRWEDLEEIDVNAGKWVDSAQDRDYWKALVLHKRLWFFNKKTFCIQCFKR